MINFPIDIRFGKKTDKEAQNFIEKYNNYYKLTDNKCLCSNNNSSSDFLLSEVDCIGANVKTLLCKDCGLIRLDKIMTDDSLAEFYNNDYVKLYVSAVPIDDKFFENAVSINSRSVRMYNLIKSLDIYDNIDKVFEIGCGAGWNLWPYYKDHKNVSGCDFGQEYLEYGIKKGLSLYTGIVDRTLTKEKSKDLIILSHLLEHISNPIEFLLDTIELVEDGKYILIEVPGVESGKDSTLTTTFHIPHIYTYNKIFFQNMLTQLGVDILYIDDEMTCVVQKPSNWMRKEIDFISPVGLENNYLRILNYIKYFYLKRVPKAFIFNMLDRLKLKQLIKKTINIFKSNR